MSLLAQAPCPTIPALGPRHRPVPAEQERERAHATHPPSMRRGAGRAGRGQGRRSPRARRGPAHRADRLRLAPDPGEREHLLVGPQGPAGGRRAQPLPRGRAGPAGGARGGRDSARARGRRAPRRRLAQPRGRERARRVVGRQRDRLCGPPGRFLCQRAGEQPRGVADLPDPRRRREPAPAHLRRGGARPVAVRRRRRRPRRLRRHGPVLAARRPDRVLVHALAQLRPLQRRAHVESPRGQRRRQRTAPHHLGAQRRRPAARRPRDGPHRLLALVAQPPLRDRQPGDGGRPGRRLQAAPRAVGGPRPPGRRPRLPLAQCLAGGGDQPGRHGPRAVRRRLPRRGGEPRLRRRLHRRGRAARQLLPHVQHDRGGRLRRHPPLPARPPALPGRGRGHHPHARLRQPGEPDLLRHLQWHLLRGARGPAGRTHPRLARGRRRPGLRPLHDRGQRNEPDPRLRPRRHDRAARPRARLARGAAHRRGDGDRQPAAAPARRRRALRHGRHLRLRRAQRLLQRAGGRGHRERPADRLGGHDALLPRSPADEPGLLPRPRLADPAGRAAGDGGRLRPRTLRPGRRAALRADPLGGRDGAAHGRPVPRRRRARDGHELRPGGRRGALRRLPRGPHADPDPRGPPLHEPRARRPGDRLLDAGPELHGRPRGSTGAQGRELALLDERRGPGAGAVGAARLPGPGARAPRGALQPAPRRRGELERAGGPRPDRGARRPGRPHALAARGRRPAASLAEIEVIGRGDTPSAILQRPDPELPVAFSERRRPAGLPSRR